MNNKPNTPDSDESARRKHPDAAEDNVADADLSVSELQTSNKSGKHSTVEKMAASRPGFGSASAGAPVPGAFGTDEEHAVTGRNAGPNTNQFRCNSCGRYFNDEFELAEHEKECRLAKASTSAGRHSLTEEDATSHASNDSDK